MLGGGGREIELESIFARVARARQDAFHAGATGAAGTSNTSNPRDQLPPPSPESPAARGPCKRDLRILGGNIPHLRAKRIALHDPGVVLIRIRGVHAEKVVIGREPVHHAIIDALPLGSISALYWAWPSCKRETSLQVTC